MLLNVCTIKDKHIPWKYSPLHEYSQLAVPSVEAEHTFTDFPHSSPVATWSVRMRLELQMLAKCGAFSEVDLIN